MRNQEEKIIKWYLWFMGGYFSLFIILRVLIGGALERDEAEQMFLLNIFELGYGTQPPLYTWVQQFFFKIFGNTIIALAFLKNILLFTAYFFIYKSVHILTKNKILGIITVASMFIIPPCAWECQRDLTHTVIALTLASIVLYFTLLIREKKQVYVLDYIILGVLSALAILSKYNLIIFIFSILIASFFDQKLKKIIFNRKIFISIGVATGILFPHFYWLINNLSLAVDGTLDKLNIVSHFNILYFLKKFISSILELLILFLILYFVIFRNYIKKDGNRFIKFHQLITIITLFLILLFFRATGLKSRWLIPLLFPTIIYFITKLDLTSKDSIKVIRKFLYVSFFFMGLIILAYILRVEYPNLFNKNPRFNFPYKKVLPSILANWESNKVIYTSSLTGGNIKYLYPKFKVKLIKDLDIPKNSLIILDNDTLVFKSFIEKKFNIKLQEQKAYFRNSKDEFKIYFGEIKK